MRVHWTHTAFAHLLAIYEHIAWDAPIYVQRIVDRLTRRSEQIAMFPQSGRVMPEYGAPDIREVIERPYRIIYRIREDQIKDFFKKYYYESIGYMVNFNRAGFPGLDIHPI